jgi:hypothetical protein
MKVFANENLVEKDLERVFFKKVLQVNFRLKACFKSDKQNRLKL